MSRMKKINKSGFSFANAALSRWVQMHLIKLYLRFQLLPLVGYFTPLHLDDNQYKVTKTNVTSSKIQFKQ